MPSFVWPTLGFGSRGEAVRRLQLYLNQLRPGQQIAVDSVYGPETQQAVIAFQAQAGVQPRDGIAGPLTWEAIEWNLGINIDLGESGAPPIPEVGEPSGWFTPRTIGLGLLGLLGFGLLTGKKRSRKA